MQDKEIADFVTLNVDPLSIDEWIGSPKTYERHGFIPDGTHQSGKLYRCSGYLSDGTYLPCIIVVGSQLLDELVLPQLNRMRSEEKLLELSDYKGPGPLFETTAMIKRAFTKVNRVSAKAIDSLESCPFALPRERREEITMETSLGWTQFTGVMGDGAKFEFGTSWETLFFDMPAGYSASDLVSVLPDKTGATSIAGLKIFRERPHFVCIVDHLDTNDKSET